MSSPADLPSRTSSPSTLDQLQRRSERASASTCATSALLTHFGARSRAQFHKVPHRYLRHVFIGVSIPVALLVGSVLPSAQQTAVAIQPVAAAYAAQGVLGVPIGDLPMADTDAALAFDDAGIAQDAGALALGHNMAAPLRVGSTIDDGVNLRRGPGTAEGVIAKLPAGTKLEVIGEHDGWYRVATANGTVGWVIDDYFTLKPAGRPATTPSSGSLTAAVASERVNLRQGPGTSYGSYGKMGQGTTVQVLARNGNWYKVRSPRGTIGWVLGELINVSPDIARNVPVTNDVPSLPKPVEPKPAPVIAPAQPAAPAPAAAASGDAASIALQYVGARYVWGGASPSGFDCSGLTLYVYKQLGLNLPHKASMQYNTPGQRIGSLGELQPGDLVFFVRTTPAKGITHVGIYTGNGMMVTAGTERTGVQNVNVYNSYWQSRFAGGVRPYR